MARTTTLVGTIGAVGKDTSIKELRRVHAKGTLQNLIIDEITRVFVPLVGRGSATLGCVSKPIPDD